jgi:hypothetical protein
MKTRLLFVLMGSGLLALGAWLVHVSNPAQANQVPEKYRDTVRKGLDYLVKHQAEDGHWEGDGGKHPVAMTGLVGLALLLDMEKRTARADKVLGGRYLTNIRKAADWLLERSQTKRDGLLFSDHPSESARYMQGHGMATLFLAGFCQYETDEVRQNKLVEVVTRAVKYIVKAQSSQGGWYPTSKVEGHDFAEIASTVVQMQALQAAENAGVPVGVEGLSNVREYLKTALTQYEQGTTPEQARSRPADTAATLVCCFNWSRIAQIRPAEGEEGLFEKWVKYCQAEIPVGRNIEFGRDELAHYYYAQAVFNQGGKSWTDYRTATFDHLQSSQNKDGSWPASEGIGVGPIYSTAVWSIVLQLDNRTHPSRLRVLQLQFTY